MGVIERASGFSNTITDFGYNVATKRLTIVFRTGGEYVYSGVPLSIDTTLLSTGAKGAYFNSNIRGQYLFDRRS